ncbi:MAG TPA: hypothetical protein VGG28_03515 [Kofleriaceae bacterium]
MARPQVLLELGDDDALARDLAAGRAFVAGCTLALGEECDLVVGELVVPARVVYVDERGAGFELAPTTVEPAKRAPTLHERLRGLTLVQQVKKAQKAEVSERILLERIYGKTVWEPLLRNPRITGPEVARIARMGALPRPMIELIVGNGAWLQIPEIRRALLANPRLGTDQILRVLRMLPKHELKLAASTTGYPMPVRDAAKRLVRELG